MPFFHVLIICNLLVLHLLVLSSMYLVCIVSFYHKWSLSVKTIMAILLHIQAIKYSYVFIGWMGPMQHLIQMRALDILHLKYWFRISSILERTKNSTITSNTSFKRSGSGLFKSWRLGAWHSYWPTTPTLYDKLNFLGLWTSNSI